MIGVRKAVSTPDKLRKAAIVASRRNPIVTISIEVLASAGLHLGSADLSDWIDALPGIEWHRVKDGAMLLSFNHDC